MGFVSPRIRAAFRAYFLPFLCHYSWDGLIARACGDRCGDEGNKTLCFTVSLDGCGVGGSALVGKGLRDQKACVCPLRLLGRSGRTDELGNSSWKLSPIRSLLCSSLTVWPGASYFTSLHLTVVIYKTEATKLHMIFLSSVGSWYSS